MDILSVVLKKVKLASAIYFESDFSGPWGMDVPRGPYAQFHIVTRGQCFLKFKGETIQLFAGDIVVFPQGTEHWLAAQASSPKANGSDVVRAIWQGKSLFSGVQVATTLVCGHFEFDRTIDHPLLHELPELIHLPAASRKEFTWLESIVNLITLEISQANPGNELIVTKLGEVLFIHALRACILKNQHKKGFMAAIRDTRISKAIHAIHQTPKTDWQLASLAQIAGMSRTSFSNKFKDLLGDTALTYIRNLRILQAKELLRESEKSVGEIAEAVGYQSEAAFNRVFKKQVAQTPLKYRQSV